MNEITKKTLIPVGLMITICGIVFWASGVNSTVSEHGKDIDRLREGQKAFKERENGFEKDVIDRLARIETEIKKR